MLESLWEFINEKDENQFEDGRQLLVQGMDMLIGDNVFGEEINQIRDKLNDVYDRLNVYEFGSLLYKSLNRELTRDDVNAFMSMIEGAEEKGPFDYDMINALHILITKGDNAIKSNTGKRVISESLASIEDDINFGGHIRDIRMHLDQNFDYVDTYEFANRLYNMMNEGTSYYHINALRAMIERGQRRKEELSRFKQDTQDHISEKKPTRDFSDSHKMMTTYSGSDIVATIMIPGEGPIIIGELKEIMFSVNREKFPVRSLGRINMKGYTRGMRTITGMLEFVLFDEAVVYRCMEKLRDQGYHLMMDELPLFDISMTLANEYGSRSSFSIYGVSTFTESGGFSDQIDGIYSMNEFFALDIDPVERLDRRSQEVRIINN